jgi:hypothetical protein
MKTGGCLADSGDWRRHGNGKGPSLSVRGGAVGACLVRRACEELYGGWERCGSGTVEGTGMWRSARLFGRAGSEAVEPGRLASYAPNCSRRASISASEYDG